MRQLSDPWIAGMEATLFTGWIYDHLVSGGALVKVAHPAMLQAIAAGEEEERSGGCAKDRRLTALRLLPGMPHGIARDSGPQAGAALPQSAGEAGSADEEQSERAADRSGCTVQPAEGASEEVLC